MDFTKKRTFSVCSLVIGKTPYTKDTFSSIKNELTWDERIDDRIIEQKKIIKNTYEEWRFICFSFEEWSIFPRAEKVFNTDLEEDEENPRQDNQIERDEQVFFMIDCQEQKIYISNLTKKHYMENLLKESFPSDTIAIKNIIDANDFLDTIDSVSTLYLSAVPNLFTSTWALWETLSQDIHNYWDEIENIEVKLTCKTPKSLWRKQKWWIKSFTQKLLSQKENQSLTKLQITWKTEENMHRVFNEEWIVDKVNIRVPVEQNWLLDANKVFTTLINKIYEQETS